MCDINFCFCLPLPPSLNTHTLTFIQPYTDSTSISLQLKYIHSHLSFILFIHVSKCTQTQHTYIILFSCSSTSSMLIFTIPTFHLLTSHINPILSLLLSPSFPPLFSLCITRIPLPCSRHISGHQKAAEPRTPRCGWDVRVRSPRDPAEVVLALREAAQGCGCQVHLAGPFLLSCTHGAAGARVAFEAEVCQLPSGLGQSSGVRFKRLWGAPLAFRDIATKVSKELEL